MPTHATSDERKHEAGEARSTAEVILEFLQVMTRHRRFITRFVLGTTLLVTIITFLLPKWYKSTSSVFPAEKADLLGGLEGIASFARALSPGRALSALGGATEADRYVAILKSGTVLTAVINKFDLVHVYDITSYPGEKTVKELLSNLEVTAEPEGDISITVYDKDPQRAADMANYFVEMLNKTNSEMSVQNARANRIFIGDRYEKNLADLKATEDSLKAFQLRYGVVALPEQTEASIKGAAEIWGQLALKEVEVGVLRRTNAEDNPSVLSAQIQVDELRKKLREMNTGTGEGSQDAKIFVPFKQIPNLGAEYIRRFRDVEIQYKILQFITPLYEQAKVEERRETPSVVVLDIASPAERKAKPRVSIYALIALVSSILVACLIVYSREFIARLKETHPEEFHHIVLSLRSDWFGLRFRRQRL